MFLYLVQHAKALPKEIDPTRSLSENGIADIRKVAYSVARLSLKPKEIFHSGKMRALQTAQILAEHLKMEDSVTQTDGLAPMDDPQIWQERLSTGSDDVMLVGHLPHLGRLSSLLLCGNQDRDLITFRMGGIVCLKRLEDGHWTIEWMITPEICPDATDQG